jgi:hypothetical protein
MAPLRRTSRSGFIALIPHCGHNQFTQQWQGVLAAVLLCWD